MTTSGTDLMFIESTMPARSAAENFRVRARAAVDKNPVPVEWFVLNAEANVDVDLTALDVLDELGAELASRGMVFAMAG